MELDPLPMKIISAGSSTERGGSKLSIAASRIRFRARGVQLSDASLPFIVRATVATATLVALAMVPGIPTYPYMVSIAADFVLEDSTISGPVVGVTHTQYSADQYNVAGGQGQRVLRSVTAVQNQHIMGFGVDNPMPAPGVYNWRSLDARVELVTSSSGLPVITLCCSPDWMKGGVPGVTDWNRLAVAPLESHFDDFAALCAAVARRYPQVTHFLVWNELKGFYDARSNNWDISRYTKLYNKVYAALKRVNPLIRVGGPYVVMDSFSSSIASGRSSKLSGPWGLVDQRSLDAVSYWIRHKDGADFIAVDGGNDTRDRGLITSDVRSNSKFSAITRWLRRQTSLPIWWAEFYPNVYDQYSPPSSFRRAAVAFHAIVKTINAGADVVLLWQPQEDQNLKSVALWTDTRVSNGGVPLPLARALEWLRSAYEGDRKVRLKWRDNAAVANDGRSTITVNAIDGSINVTRS